LSLFFNKTNDKGRTGPAWNWEGREKRGGEGAGEEMTQTMYAYVSKRNKKNNNKWASYRKKKTHL
jgi:hypothetical protein